MRNAFSFSSGAAAGAHQRPKSKEPQPPLLPVYGISFDVRTSWPITLYFFLASALGLMAQEQVTPATSPTGLGGVFLVVDIMPALRECHEDFAAQQERQACTSAIVLGLIQHYLRWPPLADCFEGTAVVSFYVQKNGMLTDFKLLRDPGAGTGDEALRAVRLMAAATGPWEPGRHGPELRPVVVRYHVPVRFKLL